MSGYRKSRQVAIAIACGALSVLALGAAQIPEVDSRAAKPINGNMHFEMPAFSSPEAWLARAAFLKKQILAGAGLFPMPEKTPLHAQIFGKLEREGYTIEKVLLETYPGFYLGGNLYRPRGQSGPFPGIVTPHGHFAYGRLENTDLVSTPARCINLARQGFVVFSYDMVGYNDTDQFPHGDRGPRLGGPREDLWNINTMGLQLWDSIRAVDFVSGLPEVDPKRIGVTGASGGGTQTFYLMAVDDRIAAAAPVNMISFISQGGGCQEAANIRVEANNVMFGAMMAPRPLLMVSAAGDWTRNTPREEFPATQGIYRLLGVEQNVENVHVNSLHNYNKESREAMYTFFHARLQGGHGPVVEKRYSVEPLQDLLVLFGRQRPADAVTMEQFTAARIEEATKGIAALRPHDAASLSTAREAFGDRLPLAILVSKPTEHDVLAETHGDSLLLGRAGKGDRVQAVWLSPVKPNPATPPTLVVHPGGTAWVRASAQKAGGLVKGILDKGGVVVGIDPFQSKSVQGSRDQNQRSFTVYNLTDDGNRVQDILTALSYLQGRTKAQTVNLAGLEIGGVWSYFARAMAGTGVNLAADMAQFQVDHDQDYMQRFYIPGLRKAGDFRAAAVLNSGSRLLLHNASAEFPADWVRDSSQLRGFKAQVQTTRASETELLSWLVAK